MDAIAILRQARVFEVKGYLNRAAELRRTVLRHCYAEVISAGTPFDDVVATARARYSGLLEDVGGAENDISTFESADAG